MQLDDSVLLYQGKPVENAGTIYNKNLFQDTIDYNKLTFNSFSSLWTEGANHQQESRWQRSAWRTPSNPAVIMMSSTAWSGLSQQIMLQPGTYYYSAYVYVEGSKTNQLRFYANYAPESGPIVFSKNDYAKWGNKWNYVTEKFTLTAARNNVYPRLELENSTNNFYLGDMKLEKGNQPTGWTPSPVDLGLA